MKREVKSEIILSSNHEHPGLTKNATKPVTHYDAIWNAWMWGQRNKSLKREFRTKLSNQRRGERIQGNKYHPQEQFARLRNIFERLYLDAQDARLSKSTSTQIHGKAFPKTLSNSQKDTKTEKQWVKNMCFTTHSETQISVNKLKSSKTPDIDAEEFTPFLSNLSTAPYDDQYFPGVKSMSKALCINHNYKGIFL